MNDNFSKNTKIEMKSINDNQFMVFTTDKDGNINYTNKVLPNILKTNKEFLIGKKIEEFKHPSFTFKVYDDMYDSLKEEGQWDGYLRNINGNQEEVWFDFYIIVSKKEDGEAVGYTGIAKVPSEIDIEEAEEQIKKKYNI